MKEQHCIAPQVSHLASFPKFLHSIGSLLVPAEVEQKDFYILSPYLFNVLSNRQVPLT